MKKTKNHIFFTLLRLCQNKKGQTLDGMLIFWLVFWILISCLLQKKNQKTSNATKVQPFLFCQGFNNLVNFVVYKYILKNSSTKVSFFHQCSKMQIISIKIFNIQTSFFQFLWFFRSKCWFQGQIILHLILPNTYTQMCFERNINGNRDVKFLIGIIGHCTDERNLL